MGDKALPAFGSIAAPMDKRHAAVPAGSLDARQAEAILAQGVEGCRLGTSVAANEALLARRIVQVMHAHELSLVIGSHKHVPVVEVDRQCVDRLQLAPVIRALDPAQPQRRGGRAF